LLADKSQRAVLRGHSATAASAEQPRRSRVALLGKKPFAKRLLAIDGLPTDDRSRRPLTSGRPGAERGHRHTEPSRRGALV
jgi:hypothetical protein